MIAAQAVIVDLDERDERGADEELVGQAVEERAENGHLPQRAGHAAVDPVGEDGADEDAEGPPPPRNPVGVHEERTIRPGIAITRSHVTASGAFRSGLDTP